MAFHPNTAGGGFVIGDPVTGGTSPAVIFIGAGNVIAQDATNFVFDNTNKRLGVGVAAPAFTGDFRGVTTTGTIVFGGAGLNDMTKSGTFTGDRPHAYIVTVAGVGVPNTYSVTKDGTAIVTAANMVAGPVLIDDGISITFAATIGHTAGNTWSFTTTTAGEINTNRALYNGSIFAFSTDLNNNISVGNSANNLLDRSVSSGNISIGANAGGQMYGGLNNINIGGLAGLRITGSGNTILGDNAFANAIAANTNVVIGQNAGQNATTTNNSVLIGANAGSALSSAQVVFVGYNAGVAVTSGVKNTLIGFEAGKAVNTKDRNTILGYQAGLVTNDNDNTIIGAEAGLANFTGIQNTYIGSQAALLNVTGDNQIAIGYNAKAGLNSNDNVVIGVNAGAGIGTGTENTQLGNAAGATGGAGSRNVLIGANTNQATVTSNGGTAIGEGAVADTSEFVGGSTTSPKLNIYFGNGKTAAASLPGTQYSVRGSGGGGTTNNQAGGAINIRGGIATGNAGGGEVRIFTSDAGASSTTPQNETENMTWTPTNKATFAYGRVIQTEGANVVAANDITLGTGNFFTITGATQINNIIATNWNSAGPNIGGAMITFKFTGAPTVKHNTAGGGARIFLAGSVDLVAANNTILGLVWDGTQFQECFRKVA